MRWWIRMNWRSLSPKLKIPFLFKLNYYLTYCLKWSGLTQRHLCKCKYRIRIIKNTPHIEAIRKSCWYSQENHVHLDIYSYLIANGIKPHHNLQFSFHELPCFFALAVVIFVGYCCILDSLVLNLHSDFTLSNTLPSLHCY